jgi:two-component system OmpR family sensor kinase
MTAMLLVIIISLSIYFYTNSMNHLKDKMKIQAKYITSYYPKQEDYNDNRDISFLNETSPYTVTISEEALEKEKKQEIKNHQNFLILTQSYPDDPKMLLTIKRDISSEYQFIKNMYYIMLTMLILGIVFIVYYSRLLSRKLLSPLKSLTGQFTNMNEGLLHQIETEKLPLEFTKLAESVNLLIAKISTSIKYRKELYIGTAHELKTPLAVMRLKNQITLMKYKKHDNVREALEQNITSIDTLNAMIHNLLEFGRAEGAQFEQPQRLNLIRFMANKCEEYELLANSQNRNFIYNFNIPHFRVQIQAILFMQIFQNFIQNALKFTPENGLVSLDTRMDADNFIIEITDEGEGIDESKDLFAPFQRSLESTGAGLGLFLAQNAAESMGVRIDICNRKDTSGAIASISFPLNRFLLKD